MFIYYPFISEFGKYDSFFSFSVGASQMEVPHRSPRREQDEIVICRVVVRLMPSIE
jgi:hypothetical protein